MTMYVTQIISFRIVSKSVVANKWTGMSWPNFKSYLIIFPNRLKKTMTNLRESRQCPG